MILLDTGMKKMPDKCSSCNFFRVESQMYCTAVVGYTIVNAPYKRRPVWCPLHEVTDSDTISRQQAIDAAIDAADDWDGGYSPSRADIIEKALNALPPIILPQPVTAEDATDSG